MERTEALPVDRRQALREQVLVQAAIALLQWGSRRGRWLLSEATD